MRSPRSFDEKRARIAEIASSNPATAATELRRMLGEKNGYLVGDAARASAELALRELVPDLADAFFRLLDDPLKNDRGCTGKNRVVEALLSLDADEPRVYLAGVRCTQREPAFPWAIDTAAGLRGLCARALFHVSYRDALLEVAPLLADSEPIARAEAAGALGDSGLDAAAAVVHVKVLLGDAEPDVLGACFKALLRLAPARYLPVVKRALGGAAEGTAEAAALALGESRVAGALAILKEAAERPGQGRLREGVLLGIALLRSDEASAFLVSLVAEAPDGLAECALSALALHRHEATLVGQIRAAVHNRGSRRLAGLFAERFGG